MLHTITHQHLSASISILGAELKSLFNHSQNAEYMWQADPDIWGGSAPVLFPIVGRLKNGEYRYNNQTYHLPKHGLARTATYTPQAISGDEISFVMQSDAQTKVHYPFDFRFTVNFKLGLDGLRVTYTVANTGGALMPFTLGSHPAFALPLGEHALTDYVIEFAEHETLDCYFLKDDLLCEAPVKAYLNNETVIPITSNLFKNDALIFRNIKSRTVYLTHQQLGQRLALDIGDAPHFGIWAKPDAPFVCFEPWFSMDDSPSASGDITEKDGIMQLAAGEAFSTRYAITL